jgi:hypothetical protein
MKQINIDDAAPQYAYGAAIDAQAEHKKYWPTHTTAKQQAAQKLKELAYAAYGLLGSRVFLTAREKFITIKVDKPSVKAAWAFPAELEAMHKFTTAHNIEIVASRKNLLFRVLK